MARAAQRAASVQSRSGSPSPDCLDAGCSSPPSREQDRSYLQTLASIQTATGQTQAALRTFAQLSLVYSGQNIPEPVDAQIQYGWMLLKARDDRKLYALVSNIASSPDMTDDQQAQFNRLWASWSVQRANGLLLTGRPARCACNP